MSNDVTAMTDATHATRKNSKDSEELADCQSKLAAVLKDNERLRREKLVGKEKVTKRSRSAEGM